MKRFKNLLFLVFGFAMLLSLTGCGDKTAITAETFKSKMEEKGYSVVDATEQFAEYDFVEKVYLALNSEKGYQIEFYDIADVDNATSFFNNNKQRFEESKGDSVLESSLSMGNNDRYALETDGKYKVVSRIEDTIIYLDIDSSNKTVVKAILDEFDY